MTGNTWIILGILTLAFSAFAIPYGFNLKSKNNPATSETYDVKSEGQTGGVTAGNIENLNVITDNEAVLKETEKQKKVDGQTALIYQTEISHFFAKFKTCLHWTLPLGNDVDEDIDSVFNYGLGYAKGTNLENLSKEIITKIFTNYDFTKPMSNYIGENNFNPTGFNNILGILKYFDHHLGVHLGKYGSSTSSDLTMQIEYMQRMVQSTISSIRLDLSSSHEIGNGTIDLISDLLLLMHGDFLLMQRKYTHDISGGLPVVVGKVLKSDETEGEILVETQFSEY